MAMLKHSEKFVYKDGDYFSIYQPDTKQITKSIKITDYITPDDGRHISYESEYYEEDFVIIGESRPLLLIVWRFDKNFKYMGKYYIHPIIYDGCPMGYIGYDPLWCEFVGQKNLPYKLEQNIKRSGYYCTPGKMHIRSILFDEYEKTLIILISSPGCDFARIEIWQKEDRWKKIRVKKKLYKNFKIEINNRLLNEINFYNDRADLFLQRGVRCSRKHILLSIKYIDDDYNDTYNYVVIINKHTFEMEYYFKGSNIDYCDDYEPWFEQNMKMLTEINELHLPIVLLRLVLSYVD